ncbi:MAG: Re/Si-specific NAD(P)(+) transhydrogenase subunit alpha [Deltaproteobacteria bacterium]|nr:Re/Si-specific NAD(P)(+) transhydrogenase subunit alpha [Deltaproteobacteria bacterium]
MAIRLAVPKEHEQNEKRVALVPDVALRLIQKGFEICLESNAGLNAGFPDALYEKAGVKIEKDRGALFKNAQVILTVQTPGEEEIAAFSTGQIVIGFISEHRHPKRVAKMREKKIVSFAMELIPRVTRAQSMDALSSQSTVAGYKAALIAANLSGRFFPMLTTAAGTIRPVKALIFGAGVAGLQAIATAKRLGAVVEAYDVRRAVKEQVQSLGARFLEIAVDAESQGGYARELTPEEKKLEQEMVSQHVGQADVVITTAQIPGRPAPRLITEEMVAQMKPGSVIIDMAAESGGNCSLTKPGETIDKNGVTIFGPINLPSLLPFHASEMYSKNIFNFLNLLTKEGKSLEPDWKDEIIAKSVLTGGPA